MRDVSVSNFGLLIAYVLPGLVTLWGLGYFSATVRSWLGASPADAPTVGGFLYVTLGSVAAGMTVSVARWAVLDTLHHSTGVRPPNWAFANLGQRLDAFQAVVESHYRHYQHYGNMLVAIAFAYLSWIVVMRSAAAPSPWAHVGFAVVAVLLFAGSRDTLRKYYARASQLLGLEEEGDHGQRFSPETTRQAKNRR